MTAEQLPDADSPFVTDEWAPRRISRKRILITAGISVVVVVGVFVLLFPQLGSYAQAFRQLGSMPVLWVVALVVAGVANIALYPFTVLVSVEGLKYWPGFIERQVGFLISCAIPGGGVFAVGAQYRILSYYRVPPSLSAAAVSADAVWTYLLTLAMPAVGVALLVVDGRSTAGYISIALLGLLVVAVSIVVIVVTLRSETGARRVGNLGERLVAPVMRKLGRPVPKLRTALVRFREQAHDLATQRWGRITIANAVAQTTPFVVLCAALGGLGAFDGHVSVAEAFAAYAIALLLVSIPITPGGLGTVDAAMVGLLTAFGVDAPVAVVADLLWRLVWFLPQILAGVGAGAGYMLSQHRAARSARAVAGH